MAAEKTQTGKRELAHPHDLLVRSILGEADLAADFLGNYLEPALAAEVDLTSLRREGGEAVSSDLSKLVGDLRFSARFKGSGEELNVFVLLEHQSRPDKLMRFRMLEYVVAAFRQHVPALKKGGRFPYPLAVVLHHGRSPWKHVPEMSELISPRPGAAGEILNLPICLIDVAAMPPDALRGHPAVCALLESLQGASTGCLAERVTGVFRRLLAVRADARLKGWTTALATYYLAVQGRVQENLDTLLLALRTLYNTTEAKEMTITFAQHWRNEGIAIGKAEGELAGKAIGRAEGKAEGRLNVARTALRKNLPVDVIADITGLPPEEIRRLADGGK